MFFETIFLHHWLFAKEFEKLFQKICKNKLSGAGANVVHNVKIEESNHINLEILTYAHLSKLQTSFISTLYICFGLC
jgi:hypothetical protein